MRHDIYFFVVSRGTGLFCIFFFHIFVPVVNTLCVLSYVWKGYFIFLLFIIIYFSS